MIQTRKNRQFLELEFAIDNRQTDQHRLRPRDLTQLTPDHGCVPHSAKHREAFRA